MGGLLLAIVLLVLVGVAHSYLGERYILIRLFRRPLPKLFGGDAFTRKTLRFAWHLTTVAWWGLAALIWILGRSEEGAAGLWVIAGVFAMHGLVALVASRGRHLSWIPFFAVAVLCARAAAA